MHITSDDVIVMFHDPSLERTTNGTGLIREQKYHGGIEHVRTTKQPIQKIPTFQELCDLLMRPECRHVKANVSGFVVSFGRHRQRARQRGPRSRSHSWPFSHALQIDIKPDNDPERLFRLMKQIVSQYPSYETDLSPRLILGLWHPKFLHAAIQHVPTLRRIHIGGSPLIARRYFWEECSGFSMYFASLVNFEGQAFLADARKAGKDVFVWTVNRPDEMIEATRWGVKAVLTDETATFRDLRVEMARDFAATRREQVGFFFRWADWRYWTLPQMLVRGLWLNQLEKRAGETFAAAAKRAKRENAERERAAEAEVAAAAAAVNADEQQKQQPASPAEHDPNFASETSTAVGTPESFKATNPKNATLPPLPAVSLPASAIPAN